MYLYERLEKEKKEREIQSRNHNIDLRMIEEKKKEDRYISLMPSISHTFGNALAFLQNYILKLFPDDMFKTVHVHSKMAHRQLKSVNKEFLKKSKPMIIFRPRIAGREEERFLKNTAFIERQTDKYYSWGLTNLQPFFNDSDINTSIKYQLNRSVMYVDVIVILSTLMQQMDYRHYLENAVRWEHPFGVQTCLEGYLSQELLKILSDLCHIPLYDEKGSTREFLSYMNGHSIYPVTYKMQGSSAQKEFFRYYPVRVELNFMDLNTDEGEQAGSIMSQYQITFSVRMEFNTNGFYYLFNENVYDLKLKPLIHPEDSNLIPVFTDILLEEDLHLAPGWRLYNRAGLMLEDPNDKINFDSMLNESIRACIKYHLDNGLPLFDLIDIKIRKQGVLIRRGEEYDLDWNKTEIQFHKQDTFHTYTILVCINLEYINSLVKTIYNLK